MKLIKSIICIVVIIMSINMFCYASTASTVDEVMSGARGFLEKGNDIVINENDLKTNVSDFVYNLLLGLALVIAVIVGMILGIKFMTASVEEKAQIKETLVPYVISCIVVFGAFGIWRLAIIVLSKW